MADGTQPSLVSKSRDVNAVANPLWVELSDGTTAVGVTGGSLDVNVTGGATVTEYAVDDVAGATDMGGLVLVVRDDALTTLTPADGDYTQLRVDSTGALWVNFTDTTIAVTQSGTWVLGANSGVDIGDVTVDNAAGAAAVNIQDGGNSITVDGSVSITGSVTVTATDLDIRNLNLTDDAVKISGNATANSLLNPIFVQNVKVNNQANEVANYSTATPAGDAASNHDYTVTGTTFLLQSVIMSCSGAMKAEIQTGPVGSLATKAVVFLNARQGDTKQVFFDPPIEVPVTSTGTVRVIRTNRNSSATDVYSTIIGSDVA